MPGNMALLAKCWPCKCEDLDLIPRSHVEKLGRVVHIVIPALGRLVDLWCLLASQPRLYREGKDNERPCLKNMRWIAPRKDT